MKNKKADSKNHVVIGKAGKGIVVDPKATLEENFARKMLREVHGYPSHILDPMSDNECEETLQIMEIMEGGLDEGLVH